MNKEELKHHIAEEIASGKELLDKLETFKMSRSDLMYEFRVWENHVQTLLLPILRNVYPELVKGIRISSPELWTNFQGQAICVMDKKLSFLDSIYQYTPDSMTGNKKDEELPYKIFISHSSKDVEFVSTLVDLIEYIGIKGNDKLFCSSVPGYMIPNSENICDYLRKQFEEYRLFVIIVHTHNYYDSTYSMNEMGAAWALKTDFLSFLTKDFEFDDMDGVIDKRYASTKVNTVDAKIRLNEVKDKLIAMFHLEALDANRWEQKRDEFLKKVNGEVPIEGGNTRFTPYTEGDIKSLFENK